MVYSLILIPSFKVLAVVCFWGFFSPNIVKLSRSKRLLVYLSNSVSSWVVISVKIEEFIANFIKIFQKDSALAHLRESLIKGVLFQYVTCQKSAPMRSFLELTALSCKSFYKVISFPPHQLLSKGSSTEQQWYKKVISHLAQRIN